ncbi:MAG: hypothetical protein E7168_06050 [Firmicutes bacterium]|nr:hypothetical protein [Bacillota bacterium]
MEISNEEFVRLLLSESNPNFSYDFSVKKMFWKVVDGILKVDIKKPFSMIKGPYSYEVYKDYSNNSSDEDNIPTSSDYVSDPYPEKDIENPIVYLYNTHQLEEYVLENKSSYSVTPNVMMLGYVLREKLNKAGIPTIVEENNVSEFLKANNWNYASSYKVTKLLMTDAKEKNPTLKYFIDLHRDSVTKKVSTATIDGKNYAKILFIVGLENKNYQENLKVTNDINEIINQKYPGLSRGIYKKEGPGVNGVYNQDFSPNTILFEVGGKENTMDEVMNTAEAIFQVLKEYIGN